MKPVNLGKAGFWTRILAQDIVFLGKTRYCDSASLQSSVLMVAGALLGKLGRMLGIDLCTRLASDDPGGVVIYCIVSCFMVWKL